MGKPRGERQVRAGFSGQPVVKCRFHPGLDTKNCFKKQIVPFISVFCVYLSMLMCVCVCVCDRVCSMCFLPVVVLMFHSMHFFSCICNLSI